MSGTMARASWAAPSRSTFRQEAYHPATIRSACWSNPRQPAYYLNRKEVWSTPTPPEFTQPLYILVDLAIGGGWPNDKLTSPQRMEVEYIRVYQAMSP